MQIRDGDAERVRAEAFAALAASRWDDALDLIGSRWAELSSGNLDLLRAVAEGIPARILAERPGWTAFRAFVDRRALGPDLAPAAFADLGPGPSPDLDARDRIPLVLAQLAACRTRGDAGAAGIAARGLVREIEQAAPDERAGILPMLPDALVQVGITFLLLADVTAAAHELERALGLAREAGNRRVFVQAASLLAGLAALGGRRAPAELPFNRLVLAAARQDVQLAGARAASVQVVASPQGETPLVLVRDAAARLLAGDSAGAIERLDRALGADEVMPRALVEAHALRALALVRQGDAAGARGDADQAVDAALENRILAPFTFISRAGLEILLALAARGSELRTLLAPALDGSVALPETPPRLVRLTDQERHLALLLRDDAPEAELAWRMGLSRDGVRVHLRSLFRKFAVHGRPALRVALREAGIL
ncbi:helix-turn-helix transcriptional regulator [Microbacterium indicum]|uniref:helix-turn-helix transcriptional regulator n=1 Tax=Microbacterium indicum TaxID=358100 RepID=UPI000426274F|nr:helix-turn-helix transcriptional regulator [Microbacterium indicum]